jgi:NAD(P)-dependent dehydrogenase (short-subunit alcohol dehydrogenase family)
MSLQGKHALVTGSSRGIGRGIALKLAEKGVKVAINYYRNEGAAAETLARVRDRGSDGFVVQADVARPEEVGRMLRRVEDEFGSLDIFVSNALGQLFAYFSPPLEISIEQWDLALDSQAKAFLVGAREAARLMPDGGRMVAITVTQGWQTASWQSYVAQGTGKAALETLVRYYAVALAQRGITVNAVSPGWIEDSVLNALPAEVQNGIREWHLGGWTPMGRLGTPADIGNAVALLCSAEAGWITGQTIAVDGGWSLMNTVAPLAIQRGG